MKFTFSSILLSAVILSAAAACADSTANRIDGLPVREETNNGEDHRGDKDNDRDSGKDDEGNAGYKPSHYKNLEVAATKDGVLSQIKEYEGFVVSFNADNHTPNWVGWELLASETSGEESRSNKFWQDIDIVGCPVTSDYTNSGYDRGHMCPAADQKWSAKAMTDCFVLANICPQDHSLNSGAWATLEKKERLWAQRDSCIVIVAGPIYESTDKKRIGDAGVRVPSSFFKVIAAPYLEQPRGIAFIYPNMSSPGNMMNYVVSIDDVEEITGFDFFSNLPDEIENKIESKSIFKEWDR